jgi:hypothetical protein
VSGNRHCACSLYVVLERPYVICAADPVAIHTRIEGIIIAFKDEGDRPYVQAPTLDCTETRRNALLDCLTTVVRRLVQV